MIDKKEDLFDTCIFCNKGELFDKSSGGEYYGISTEGWLVEARDKGGILRKVEIDPVEELARKLAVFGGEEDCAFPEYIEMAQYVIDNYEVK